ncbi:MAG TPA: hypothetical protein VL993_14880 [Stellaceae bacterium]|nr:hypothetical protein [Stellaceae bacterium]
MTDVLDTYERQLKDYGLDSEIVQVYAGQSDEIRVTLSGLVAAANRE